MQNDQRIINDVNKYIGNYIKFFAFNRPSSIQDFKDWYTVASSDWTCIKKDMDDDSHLLNVPRVRAIIELFEKAENIFYEIAFSNSYSPVFNGWPEIKKLASNILYNNLS